MLLREIPMPGLGWPDLTSLGVGILVSWVLLILLGRLVGRRRSKPLPEPDPDVLRLCKEGGHHDWGRWEDLTVDPRTSALIQVRRCAQCGLANQVNMNAVWVAVQPQIRVD